jgi:transcription elongation factor GreA
MEAVMFASPRPDVLVLSSLGRQQLTERMARTQQALSQLAERVKAGQASAEELAEQQRLLAQVDELNRVLAHAADIRAVDEDPSIVEVGDEIVVEGDDGSVEKYALVHPAEVNADDGRISAWSPLGRALLGARPGDRVLVDAPAGTYAYVVRERHRLA